MAPNTKEVLNNAAGIENNEIEVPNDKSVSMQPTLRKYELVYTMISVLLYIHVAAVYGLYLCCTSAMWSTILFNSVLFMLAVLGLSAGAHRLWSHRSYKAKLPLQILLMVMNSIAYQFSIINWVRDHRLHHRFSDTDADPHNPTRGFFFAHVGWLCVVKHPEVARRGKTTEMADIYANPVLQFQKKHAFLMFGGCCFILPTVLPMCLWGESLTNAWHVVILRYVINLTVTLAINSVTHRHGMRPHDKTIKPGQNELINLMTLGEGYHNFHHVYPWDYKSSEFGNKIFNPTKWFIDFFAWIGWAYDLKTVPEEVVRARALRTGDGSYTF